MNNDFMFGYDPNLQFLRSPSENSHQLLDEMEAKVQDNSLVRNYKQPEFPECNERESRIKANSKEKKKTFYRDKMAQLVDNSATIQQYHYADCMSYEKNKSPISRDEQLKRNRESARLSRQRKKQYIEILEAKNLEYQNCITTLKDRLREVEWEKDQLKESNQIYVKDFMSRKTENYEKLAELLRVDNNTPDETLYSFVSQMQRKYGAAGVERNNLINYFINQILQNIVGDVHKYLIHTKLSNQREQETSKMTLEVIQILNVNEERHKYLAEKYHPRFDKEFTVFKDLIQDFYGVSQSIQNQARIIENIFDDFRREFKSRDIASLLLWIEENKFCRDVKKLKGKWIDSLQKEDEIVDELRKQTKLQN